MTAIVGVGKVFAIKSDIVLVDEVPDVNDEFFVKWSGTADRQGKTVAYDGLALADFSKLPAQPATKPDPVFWCEFKEIQFFRNSSLEYFTSPNAGSDTNTLSFFTL